MAARPPNQQSDGSKSMASCKRPPALLDQGEPTCAYCGQQIRNDREAMKAHVLSCEKHPAHVYFAALCIIREEIRSSVYVNTTIERIDRIAQEALGCPRKMTK